MKTAWIIGASTGLGRQVAEKLAAAHVNVVLSSRNQRDLEALSSHIRNKFNATASVLPFDLEKITDTKDSLNLLEDYLKINTYPDMCFVLAGSIDENDVSIQAADVMKKLMQLNFTGPVLLINELLKHKKAEPLYICVASSVAAARARGKNIAYGTAKRALEQYCFGLMHAMSQTNSTIHIYRFGYMDTNLSYGHQLPFPPASAGKVAGKLIKNMEKSPGLYYIPGYWYFISLVLMMIPFQIYKRLKF